jgi:cullin-4
MPSPEDPSADYVSSHSPSPKRKYQDPQKKFVALRKSTTSENEGTPSAQSTLTFSKRLKTSHPSGNTSYSAEMSKLTVKGPRPPVVDLTRTSNFQPNTGAKKLVIKNLRTTSRQDVDEYYKKTETELDDALTSIFKRQSPKSPLEVLCRGVETLCRRGQADELFRNLKRRCQVHLEKNVIPQMQSEAGVNSVNTLKTVLKFWTAWNEQSVRLSLHV